jgi:enoyl-CoA hydratase/carnithine racemase
MPFDPNAVLYEVKDGIATVTLNRPERRNAANVDLMVGLRRTLERAAADPECRVIVLTGAGSSFCVGADMAGSGDPRAEEMNWRLDLAQRGEFQSTYGFFPIIPKPIISMVNGAAAGVGLLFAVCSDMRFAAEDAVLTTAFVRRGRAGEFGMCWYLTRIIGHTHASDLTISGRRFTGAEAMEMGLFNGVAPKEKLAAMVYAYAADLVENCSTLADAHRLFKAHNKICFESGEAAEGARSFMEKRPPRFKPLSV